MSQRLTRGEISLLGILVVCGIAALVFFVILPSSKNSDSALPTNEATEEDLAIQQKLEEESLVREQSVQSSLSLIGLGETVALANTGDDTYVPWEGTMEVTIDDATLYDSLSDAQAATELGDIVMSELKARDAFGTDVKLLVMHITVANVDASISNSDQPYLFAASPVFDPYYPEASAEGELGSVAWTSYWDCFAMGTFDGAKDDATDREAGSFELEPGATRTLTLGYWVPGSSCAIMPGCTDYSKLIVRPSVSGDPGTVVFELGLTEDGASS
jgi:hypothetical protein